MDRIAGLKISVDGAPVSWTRDPVEVYAFHVHTPRRGATLDIDFEYLSPTNPSVGKIEFSQNILMVEWNDLVLYPAGYFARRIPVEAQLTLPAGWQFGTALEHGASTAGHTVFRGVDLETLIDSPVYAGRYAARLDLDPGSRVPVYLDLFADRPALLAVKPEQLEAHRELVRQAYKLFGSHHYAHYDFLYSLSDQVQQQGLEHHQSSEDGSDPELFTEWDKTASERDLLPHEFTHSWNGKFRRPADLWTPSYEVPMRDSLLWVYEGQTQYWGDVLAARSGLRTQQQALDDLAATAAFYETQPGRQWRPLTDTTNDEIINPRRPQSWHSWQRFEDYYSEGALIWLDIDTLIRERSENRRSLDDFARSFFGINDGSFVPITYTFEEVVKGLNAVEAYDWSAFLKQRVERTGQPAPLDGLRRGGYRLEYSEVPSELQKAAEMQRRRTDLRYSIGIEIDDKGEKGSIAEVLRDSAAYNAKLTSGAQILAVNGVAYSPEVLKDAIRAARDPQSGIELIVKNEDRYLVAKLDYHGGLRYPHLERIPGAPPRLEEILAPRH